MTWTKLGDNHFDRPFMLELSRSAQLLDIEAMVWSNRLLTNGRIPRAAINRISGSESLDDDIAELVECGRWEVIESGWQLDAWEETQETAEQVEARRQDTKQRQAKFRDRRDRHNRDDHSACHPKYCPDARNSVTNDVTNAVTNGTPTRPDPTRPSGRDRGRGGARADALSVPAGASTPSAGARNDGYGHGPPPEVLEKMIADLKGEIG